MPSWKVRTFPAKSTEILEGHRKDVRRSDPFGESLFDGPGRDLAPRHKHKLGENIPNVAFDGSFADNEHFGDLAVAFSLGNQACHFTLARRQPSKGLFGGPAWCRRGPLGEHR